MKIVIIIFFALIIIVLGALSAIRLKSSKNDFSSIAPAWIDHLRKTHPDIEIEWTDNRAEHISIRGIPLMLKQLTFRTHIGPARIEGIGYSIAYIMRDGSWKPTPVLLMQETREAALDELERLFKDAEKAEN